jgi:hypothetical protein
VRTILRVRGQLPIRQPSAQCTNPSGDARNTSTRPFLGRYAGQATTIHLGRHWRVPGGALHSRLARAVQAGDLAKIARMLSEQNRSRDARAVFASSLRRKPTPRALAWALIVSAPDQYGRRLADRVVSLKWSLYPVG